MLSWLIAPVDSRPLGLARILVGLAAISRLVVGLPLLLDLASGEKLLAPYVDWAPRPNVPIVGAVVATWLIAAILFTAGWRVAISGTVLFAAILSVLTLDQQLYANHLYLMVWLVGLLTLADAGAGMAWRRPSRPVARWPLLLLMLQASVVYVFSALTKINDDFLSGLILARVLGNGIVGFPETLRTPLVLSVLALVVIATELGIGLLLWLPKYRPFALLAGLALHTGITLLMAPTGELFVFSLEMMALYPLFLGSATLAVRAPSDYPIGGLIKFDLLRVLDVRPASRSRLTLIHREAETVGSAARVRILEHLVPWLWIAPALRLPVINRIYDSAERRRIGRLNQGQLPRTSRNQGTVRSSPSRKET